MKKIVLGTSDFKEMIDYKGYYVDKTLIIKEFLEDNAKVIMLPRPRRFGKTLNLSTIRYFLEKCDEDRGYLFKGLKIEQETEIMKRQGQCPIIYLTFKDEKHGNFQNFFESMAINMSRVYRSFDYLIPSLSEEDKKYFNEILNRRSTQVELEKSALFLSTALSDFYNEKVFILIDEYDTPIHEGYFKGYYPEVIAFMRGFLSAALKDNVSLERAMVTGILRVAKESIFSGLNNLEVYSLLGERYSDKFGFTENEVEKIILDFDMKKDAKEFKDWYNGYVFGKTTIYNPWSVISYLNKVEMGFTTHWVNTSENTIIKTLLAKGDETIKISLDKLYNGGFIETPIDENIVMNEISESNENVWSFLLLSGYLKVCGKFKPEGEDEFIYRVMIPNKEIKVLYKNIITKWFSEGFISSDFNKMLKALVIGEIEIFEDYFSQFVLKSFSYFDVSGENPEKVYHAFVLGMLVALNNSHEVISNRECGLGRYDVSLIPKDTSKIGYIIEFKSLRRNYKKTIEEALDDALNQIEKQKYDVELLERGITNIKKLAIVFKGKEVFIKDKDGE